MISKLCTRCGRRVPVGGQCVCASWLKYKPCDSDKYSSDTKQFYHTAEWKKARAFCISRCFGLDLYSFYALRKIEYGQTVHHIVPLIDDRSQGLNQENLIYLTESNHRIIHELYKTDFEGTAKLLRGYLKMFLQT